MIVERVVTTIAELTHELNVLPNHFAFRGQADANWELQSTLERVIGGRWSKENARRFETYSLDVFKSKFHIYSGLEHIPKSKLSWLSVMQHYGVPTRLIDYTAIMDLSLQHIRKADTQFQETRLTLQGKQDLVFDEVVDRYSYDIAWVTEPIELNARIDRQSGTFLIAGNLEKRIESIVNLPLYESATLFKIRIPSSLYEGAYVALRKMNINSKSIYGDLAGLAKSIKMELQSYTT